MGAMPYRGANRFTRNPPAFTIPAWSMADTGVGASIVPGSHTWKGNWADLVMIVTTSTTVMAVTEFISHHVPFHSMGIAGASFTARNKSVTSSVPNVA